MSIRDTESSLRLQRDINALHVWCELNSLPLNLSKCKIMTFSRSKSPCVYDYTIGNRAQGPGSVARSKADLYEAHWDNDCKSIFNDGFYQTNLLQHVKSTCIEEYILCLCEFMAWIRIDKLAAILCYTFLFGWVDPETIYHIRSAKSRLVTEDICTSSIKV